MEMININDIKEFKDHGVVKKVPMLTSNLMGSLLFIDNDTDMLAVRTKGSKEMHLVLEGAGKIEIDDEMEMIGQGSIMLIPAHSRYHYTTSEDKMVVLVVKLVDHGHTNEMEPGEQTKEEEV
jgi:mannose-6-phosphate isomerase-like protein (cupin superfamily)